MPATKKASAKEPAAAPSRGPRALRAEGALAVALEELALVGYRALSVEVVATKAGLNKTTLYRRWPTKKELVLAALRSVVPDFGAIADTGSLRRDLIALGSSFGSMANSVLGQSLFRIMAVERAEPEFLAIAETLKERNHCVIRDLLVRAERRGEISARVDPSVLIPTFIGALHWTLFVHDERVDDLFVAKIVDLLLLGVKPRRER